MKRELIKSENMKWTFFLGLLFTVMLVAPVAMHAQVANAGTTLLVATPVSGSQSLLLCDSADGGQHLACENVSTGNTAVVASQQTCTSYPEYQCQQDYVNPNSKGSKLSKKAASSQSRETGEFSTSSGGPQLCLSY